MIASSRRTELNGILACFPDGVTGTRRSASAVSIRPCRVLELGRILAELPPREVRNQNLPRLHIPSALPALKLVVKLLELLIEARIPLPFRLNVLLDRAVLPGLLNVPTELVEHHVHVQQVSSR